MSDQYLGLRYSDDGGKTFCNWKERDLGDTGQFRKRLRFQRLGSFVERVFEVECSAPRHVSIIGAVMIGETER